jgi:hypothetical protein
MSRTYAWRIFLSVLFLALIRPPVAVGIDADFPEAVRNRMPIFQGAHLLGARADAVEGKRTRYQVDLSINDAPYEEVVRYYRRAARERGWRIMEAVDHGGAFMLIARAKGYQIDVSVTSESEGVRVRITVL